MHYRELPDERGGNINLTVKGLCDLSSVEVIVEFAYYIDAILSGSINEAIGGIESKAWLNLNLE